ncbi:serine/threonine protein phosphatase [Paenibacillus rigui]|uniref:Serine/threonine protein phosphatase n=2 Tax=Paenibacillus rigui TaxID=554312 RepID=A0A229UPH4_9BACL|nr:serine/threonine protein phosphatase [Paenibacillus rigui]
MLSQSGAFPYVVLLALGVSLIILLMVRQALVRSQAEQPIVIGNGQTMGQREEQDDYFSAIVSPNGTIAVLADGISGLSGGRAASTTAVSTFVKQFLKLEHASDMTGYFTETAALANKEVMQSLKGAQGGTTLVAAVISDGLLYWGAVGDSLLRIFRNGEFIDVNSKHTLESVLEERYASGDISREEALGSPMRKQLVNYLGYEAFKNIEIGSEPIRLLKRDKVILCSDGIYNTLTEIELEDILTKPLSPYDAAQEIIAAIEEKKLKHQDNATIVILEKGW